MMRYQRVSPDCIPLSNGRKPSLRACNEDEADSNGRIPNYSTSFDAKPIRARSVAASGSAAPDWPPFPFPDPVLSDNQPIAAATAPAPKTNRSPHEINGVCSGTGNVLLQWGHKKRSRGPRAENRPSTDESPGSHRNPRIKIQRRAAAIAAAGSAAASAMPPPGASYTRGANLRPCTPARDSMSPLLNRCVEERSGGQSRSEKRSPPASAEKAHKTGASASLPNGAAGDAAAAMNAELKPAASDYEAAGGEKLNLEQFEWPRIFVSLSRKEKEDDFLAMKGTKLPQRPKKRAKAVEKALQYCFPGMFLSDLAKGRYDVREKKCVKKKRRGLKGMESMDSDSE